MCGGQMSKRVLQMAMMNFKTFSVPGATHLMDVARGLLGGSSPEIENLIPIQKPKSEELPTRPDQIRYEQMLERELDRQLLTEVEREDSDTLDRVRAALYAD